MFCAIYTFALYICVFTSYVWSDQRRAAVVPLLVSCGCLNSLQAYCEAWLCFAGLHPLNAGTKSGRMSHVRCCGQSKAVLTACHCDLPMAPFHCLCRTLSANNISGMLPPQWGTADSLLFNL
jgi:hypothetical protein